MKALWARPQKDVTEEEYAEFYRHVSHDWQEPLETIRLAAEGTFEYQALLFLPQHAPMDLYMRERRRGVQLYVRRVFIMDDCEALVPEYLRFVKGVVDAADLSLNVSREILQQDRQITAIRRRLVQKVLSTVKTMMSRRRGEVRDVLGAVRPRGEGGSARGPGQPRRHPGDRVVRVHPRRGEADHPGGLRVPHEGRPGARLLHDAASPARSIESVAAHGGVPRPRLRGPAAHRPDRRGLGRPGRRVRRQGAPLDRQGPGGPGDRGAAARRPSAARGVLRLPGVDHR